MLNEALIKTAVESLKDLDNLKAILLFGSYARGEEDKKTDIDLLVVIDSKQPKKYLKDVVRRVSSIDKEGLISLRLTNLRDYDPGFFQNVLREGKILFGCLVVDNKKLALKPYRLVNYDLSKLDNSKKVRISRRVYGYISKKDNKRYEYKGLKDEEEVLIYPNSTVLIPENSLGFIEFLKRENVPFKEKKIWL